MGIKQRHERDREAVRRAILDAARDLFVSEGYQNVSLRKIAERIEYSPAAIYGYFSNKDDIFFALAEEGFRLLRAMQPTHEDSVAGAASALDRVREICWSVYAFSRQHPQYFALMFIDRSVPRICREYECFAPVREMKCGLAQQIQQCIDEGVFPETVQPLPAVRLLMAGLV